MRIHFVKTGETLQDISTKYGVTREEIIASNTAIESEDTDLTGKKLIIPMKQMTSQTPANPVYPAKAADDSLIANVSATQSSPAPSAIHSNSNISLVANATHSIPNIEVEQSIPSNSYPGLTMSPFAQIPVPAQEVFAQSTAYAPYNTPYHMTNYGVPQSMQSNAIPIPNYPSMTQPISNYQPFPANLMPYSNSANYEYYNTYSNLTNTAGWASTNPQPHGQSNQPVFEQEVEQSQTSNQNVNLDIIEEKPERRKLKTSSNKERAMRKPKKSSLHEQVLRLHQTRSKVHSR